MDTLELTPYQKIEKSTRSLRESYHTALKGLAELYGVFDLMTYPEYDAWLKRLDAVYEVRFDELRELAKGL